MAINIVATGIDGGVVDEIITTRIKGFIEGPEAELDSDHGQADAAPLRG